jgi:PucR C-terminal helix-turn-helix domain
MPREASRDVLSLVPLAEPSGHLEDMVRRLAERLKSSVVLIGLVGGSADNGAPRYRISLIAYSKQSREVDQEISLILAGRGLHGAPDGDAENWQRAVAARATSTSAKRRNGVGGERICLPIRHVGCTYGYLFVLPDPGIVIGDSAMDEAMQFASQAGAQLACLPASTTDVVDALVELVEGDRHAVERSWRRIAGSGEFSTMGPFRVLAVDGLMPATALDAMSAPVGSLTAVIVPACDVQADLAHATAERLAGAGSLVGIGGRCRDLRGVPRSWRQAQWSVRVAQYDSRFSPVASWDQLGAYRIVATGGAGLLQDAVLTSSVRALLDHRNVDLLDTARAYLDHAGDAAATSAYLGIHRQTLYYRLAKTQEITGLDLSVGADRLELHIGLTLGRFLLSQSQSLDPVESGLGA